MKLAGRRVLIVGAGKSGLAAARFCASRGAAVVLSDVRTESALGTPVVALREASSIHLELGGHRDESFTTADLIVLSPGVPALPQVVAARARGVEVVGEVELAARFLRGPIVGVTGTNGKSTVTSLAGQIGKESRRPTFVGGNLGMPLIEAVGSDADHEDGLIVAELSSFQLETCLTLRPRAAALLNLSPDHLERYEGLEAYGAAKLRIGAQMTGADVLVVNDDDLFFAPRMSRFLPEVKKLCFGLEHKKGRHAFVEDRELVVELSQFTFRFPIGELQIVGRHNLSNALAALLLMLGSGLCDIEAAGRGLSSFRPLPHRMEPIGERRGLRFFDDSKATNVDSVVAGLDGFPLPYALIAGGRDKGGSYLPLRDVLREGRCRAAVLIGEAADRIATELGNSVRVARARTLEEAVRVAADLCLPGDAVILSPACSSYDMFQDYEHRARAFRAAVEAL
jgi:UDP-N-acetylmuramoylalanine--D-glutamate ligase